MSDTESAGTLVDILAALNSLAEQIKDEHEKLMARLDLAFLVVVDGVADVNIASPTRVVDIDGVPTTVVDMHDGRNEEAGGIVSTTLNSQLNELILLRATNDLMYTVQAENRDNTADIDYQSLITNSYLNTLASLVDTSSSYLYGSAPFFRVGTVFPYGSANGGVRTVKIN